jgi:hypothetical protein
VSDIGSEWTPDERAGLLSACCVLVLFLAVVTGTILARG